MLLLFLLLLVSVPARAQVWHCPYGERAGKLANVTVAYKDGYAYRLLDGNIVRWNLDDVPVIRWHSANISSRRVEYIQETFSDWEHASGIDFDYVRRTNSEKPTKDGDSVVYSERILGGGVTHLSADFSGEIVEVDIGIHPDVLYGNPPLLRSISRHEIGHLLGLIHYPDPNSLMYPTIDERDDERFIDEGSLKGVLFLYRELLDQEKPDPILVWADFNEDRKIDFQDFLLFTQMFMRRNSEKDLDGDGIVAFHEFTEFARVFGNSY